MRVKDHWGKWTACADNTPGAVYELCYDWKRDTGGPNGFHCERPGHWTRDCPLRKQSQATVATTARKAEPAVANVSEPVSKDDFCEFQTTVMRALQRIEGVPETWD